MEWLLLEAFRIYFSAIPCLADRVVERLASAVEEGVVEQGDAQAVRRAHQVAAGSALARLREGRLVYRNLLFPHLSYRCQDCGEEVQGAYWELVNPITNDRGVFRTRLVHELITHRRMSYQESVLNFSGTVVALEDHTWDFQALLRILDGLSTPPAVLAEIQTMLQPVKPSALAAKKGAV
ncbi:MAG: hypothetical protein VKN33_00220 [Candidatus Sericytochromatia bacterium]|nr:hypothetical protein [Candidatus Sericytochromatia bacterium]